MKNLFYELAIHYDSHGAPTVSPIPYRSLSACMKECVELSKGGNVTPPYRVFSAQERLNPPPFNS